MTLGQIIYCAAIAGLFAWRGQSYAAWVLALDQLGILAVLGLFDLGMIGRSDATLYQMVVDFMAGAALAAKPGLPRLLSLGYAITVPLYAANILFSLATGTTFALVMGIGFLQLAVAGIGQDSGGGGRVDRRHMLRRNRLVLSRGNMGMGEGGLAQSRDHVSPDRRGA